MSSACGSDMMANENSCLAASLGRCQVSEGDLEKMIAGYDGVFFNSLPRREQEVIVLTDVVFPLGEDDGEEQAMDVLLDSNFRDIASIES